ncbi:MAG: hypothetical protein A3C53_04780 [Omnitrophica WOR_2 bacterium RIFCSPHIGHO2_02_FULL_68_15]|nr:MAG: hypothetical protein A3C53_04780 [Omnitrophica WOR_2 bacterium RIFCSPHIGHO2_02_FULL_68_15]
MTSPARLWWGTLLATAGVLAGARLPVTLADSAGPPHRPRYGEIVFLGAILTSVEDLAAETHPRTPLPVEPTPLPREPLEGLRVHDGPQTPAAMPQLFRLEKPLPRAVTTVVMTPRRATAPVWIRGPARLRTLRHRPPLADYLQRVPLARLRSHNTPATVELELRFKVAPDGAVRHAEVLRSSGDPLLDLVGAQYLADWRFDPLDTKTTEPGPEPWGQVTVRLDLGPAGS